MHLRTNVKMNFIAVLALCLVCMSAASVGHSSDLIVKKTTEEGKKVEVTVLVEGQIMLFQEFQKGVAVPFEESYAPDTMKKINWYLGKPQGKIVYSINEKNYKAILFDLGAKDVARKIDQLEHLPLALRLSAD
ncbi:MAG: hypothetical protein AAFO07_00625 [Bacteroidota bacterium]